MTFPTVAVVTTNLDSSGDSPASARSDLLDAVQKLNQMIAHVSTFNATLMDDADAATARTTLGLGTGNSPSFSALTISSAIGIGGQAPQTGTWTTQNWGKLLALPQGKTLWWPKGSNTVAIGIGRTTEDILRFIASTADDDTAAAIYPIAFNMATGAITATGTVSGAASTGAGTSSAVVGVASSSGFGVYGSSSSGVGVQGISNSSYGVQGISSSGGIGVYGESNNNYGVQGFSGTATGVLGQTTSGLALWGSSGSGPALKLQPSSQPTTSVSDGSFYCSSTGQPYVRISGAWKSINVT